MPLLIFSEQKHVSKIWNGEKKQTTRLVGKRKIKQGDKIFPYFKSRMKKGTCYNCIDKHCPVSNYYSQPIKNNLAICQDWSNYFGTAEVSNVRDFDPNLLSLDALEAWAIADGFESFAEADEWFTRVHSENWINKPWQIIYFEGDWLKEV